MSVVNFIKPLGVIGVLLLVESITKLKKKERPGINIIEPANNEVVDYLLRVDFIKALQSLCEWQIPEGMKASGREMRPVIPITRFHSFQEIDDIANAMRDKFHTEFAGLTTLLQPCHVVFSELAINAVEHANSNGGFILAQQYNYPEGPLLEIAVGDCGIGISKSLEQNPVVKGQFSGDRQAIMCVLNGGFSRNSDPHRGYGLNCVKEELTRITDRSLTLRSGNGYAILRTGGRPYSANCAYFPGTLAHAAIPC